VVTSEKCQPDIAGCGLLSPQKNRLGIGRLFCVKKGPGAFSGFMPVDGPLDLASDRPFLDGDFSFHLFANVCQFFIANLPRTCVECRANAERVANFFCPKGRSSGRYGTNGHIDIMPYSIVFCGCFAWKMGPGFILAGRDFFDIIISVKRV